MENKNEALGADGDARVALAAVRQGQAAAADRLVTPIWYHPTLGGLAAMLVLACGSGITWLPAAAVILFSLGSGALAAAYKSSTGMWVSGLQAGRAGRWAYALMAVAAACLLLAFLTAQAGGPRWITWLAAIVTFVATIVIGRRFDVELRAQIRRGE